MTTVNRGRNDTQDLNKTEPRQTVQLVFKPKKERMKGRTIEFTLDLPGEPLDILSKWDTDTTAFLAVYAAKIKIMKGFYDWFEKHPSATAIKCTEKAKELFEGLKFDYSFRSKGAAKSFEAKTEENLNKKSAEEQADAIKALEDIIKRAKAKLKK